MPTSQRRLWSETLTRIASPVLEAAAARHLRTTMQVEAQNPHERAPFATLEAVGRTLAGLAPWLACEALPVEEQARVQRFGEQARAALASIADPDSPDFGSWDRSHGDQPLVDAAFVAHALLRAPRVLWDPLDNADQARLLAGLRAVRSVPLVRHMNNWLLFRAMTEAALFRFAGTDAWTPGAVDFALAHQERWYLGDGVYGDGDTFRADYYNSFVIQPMLIDVLETLHGQRAGWDGTLPRVLARARRGAEILERLVSPEGTYPPLGRSLCYRVGAFQLLAQMALRRQLPEGLGPAQVRCALSAVIERQFAMPGTFTDQGFLTLGFAGAQPGLAEHYVSTASAYLCTTGFLPLGLPESDPFWSDPAESWTGKRLWAGEDVARDRGWLD